MQTRLIAIGVFLVALVIGVIVISASGDDDDPTAEATRPTVDVPDGPPPKELETTDLTEGEGTEAQTGDTVTMQYVGVNYSDGQEFDTSWDDPQPLTFQLGAGSVIPGWEQGIPGMKVGGRRELVIPPDLAYGKQGSPPAIGPNETLVFVVDLLDVQSPAG
jgi:peptidylprolyl isomerase